MSTKRCRRALHGIVPLAFASLFLSFPVFPAEPAVKEAGTSPMPVDAGYVPLTNAFQLKAYFFAYSRAPVDKREFTRYVGEPGGKEGNVDAAIRDAQKHPGVMLDIKEVALHPYDKSKHAFPMDNRLFLSGVKYYFDVSPYHYVYAGGPGTNAVPCDNAAAIAKIQKQVNDYEQFNMRIYGHVESADAGQHSVIIRLVRFELLDGKGNLLLEQRTGG